MADPSFGAPPTLRPLVSRNRPQNVAHGNRNRGFFALVWAWLSFFVAYVLGNRPAPPRTQQSGERAGDNSSAAPTASSSSQNDNSASLDADELRRKRAARFGTLQTSPAPATSSAESTRNLRTSGAAPSSETTPSPASASSSVPLKSSTSISSSKHTITEGSKANSTHSRSISSASSSSASSSAPTGLSSSGTSSIPSAAQTTKTLVDAKLVLGVRICRLLSITIPTFRMPPIVSGTLRSARISVDYELRESTGPEIVDLDSLLFAVKEVLPTPASYVDYLFGVYKRVLRDPEGPLGAAVKRSVQTQIFLALQYHGPELTAHLIKTIKILVGAAGPYLGFDEDPLSRDEFESLFVAVFQNFSAGELLELLQGAVTLLLLELNHEDEKRILALSVLATLWNCGASMRVMFRLHPSWNAPTPTRVDLSMLGAMFGVSNVGRPKAGFPMNGPYTTQHQREVIRLARQWTEQQTHITELLYRIVTALMSEPEGYLAFFDWIKKHVAAAPIKPNSLQYTLEWAQSPELQIADGFFINLTAVMLKLARKEFSTGKAPIIVQDDQADSSKNTHTTAKTSAAYKPSYSTLPAFAPDDFQDSNRYGLKFSDTSLLLQQQLSFLQTIELRESTETSSAAPSTSPKTKLLPINDPSLLRQQEIFIFTWYLTNTLLLPVLEHTALHLTELSRLYNRPDSAAPPQHQNLYARINNIMCYLTLLHCSLEPSVDDAVEFFDVTLNWLLALGLEDSIAQIPTDNLNLSTLFKVPSFIVQTIVEYLLCQGRLRVPLLDETRFVALSASSMRALMNIFGHPRISNYHIHTASAELFGLIYAPSTDPAMGSLTTIMSPNPRAELLQLTLPLIKYYVGVEKTGSRSAFYEKFPVRRSISMLLQLPLAHPGIISLTKNKQIFVPFLTVLMNDTLFLLDESLSKIKRIAELKAIISQPPPIPGEPVVNDYHQRQADAKQELGQVFGMLKSLSTFGNESFLLFEVISSLSLKGLVHQLQAIRKSQEATGVLPLQALENIELPVMLDDQLLDQMCVMLNYYMDHFASPKKRTKLLTSDSATDPSNAFVPSRIVSCLVVTYLNLDQMCAIMEDLHARKNPSSAEEKHKFQRLVVTEGRSYNINLFWHALKLLDTQRITFNPTSLELLRLNWPGRWEASKESQYILKMSDDVFEAVGSLYFRGTLSSEQVLPCVMELLRCFKAALHSREAEVKASWIPDEDIPEEFLDELLASLMRDPVRLPSGHIVDRSTIIRQLSGHDKSDPFTRQPLTMEQLVPETELKNKIEAWIVATRLERSRAQDQASPSSEE